MAARAKPNTPPVAPEGQEKPPTDLTGTRMQQQAIENVAEQQAAAERMSLATAVAEQQSDEVIDYTDMEPASDVEDPDPVEIDDPDEDVTIRMRHEVSRMTFGTYGEFSFTAGRQYKVKRALAEHLIEKGYAWT